MSINDQEHYRDHLILVQTWQPTKGSRWLVEIDIRDREMNWNTIRDNDHSYGSAAEGLISGSQIGRDVVDAWLGARGAG